MNSIFYQIIDYWNQNVWELKDTDQSESIFEINVYDPTWDFEVIVLTKKVFCEALYKLPENEECTHFSITSEYCEDRLTYKREGIGFLCHKNNQTLKTCKIGQKVNIRFSKEFQSTIINKINDLLTSLTSPLVDNLECQIISPLSLESQRQVAVKIHYDNSRNHIECTISNLFLMFAFQTKDDNWAAYSSKETLNYIIYDKRTEEGLIMFETEDNFFHNGDDSHSYFKFTGSESCIAKLFKTILTYQIHPFTYKFIAKLHSFVRSNQLCNLNFEYK